MNSKLSRLLILILQIFCLAVISVVCVYGIVMEEGSLLESPYLHTVVRVAIIFLLTISYYKTSVSSFNPGNPFFLLYLLSITIIELRILTIFTELTGWSILPPRVSVRLHLFAQFMVYFLMAGYALNYQNNDHSAISRFIVIGMTGCLFLAITLPATQDISGLWNLKAPFTLIAGFCTISIIANLILAFTEPTKLGAFRQIATIMMLTGNFSLLFQDLTMVLIGTGLLFFGGFVAMMLTLRNSVIL